MAVIEPKLQELQGASRLALGFFNSLIRRIECTKPTGSDIIFCTQKPDGIEVSLKGGNAITLTVCSAGDIKKLVVFYDEKRSKQATEDAGLTWP